MRRVGSILENEACWFNSVCLYACVRIDILHGSSCLVDRVGVTTKWIQHGTVLVDWQNTRTDNAVATGGQQLLGETYRDFSCLGLIGNIFQV